MKTQSFSATIVWDKEAHKKKVEITSLAYYATAINKFQVGDKVSLYITNKKPKRSEKQNRYYWSYMTAIAEETGHSPEDVHEWAKGKCLPSTIIELFGDKVRKKKSTTDLTVGEFIDYMMKIEQETGIQAPPVKEYLNERDKAHWKV